MTLATRIAKKRKERGFTQKELADTIDTSAPLISQLENDNRTPSLDLLKRLALALNTTVGYLTEGEEDPSRSIPSNLTFAREQRLRFIDFLLYQYGTYNRSAGMDYFGISQPQSSRDIADYIAIAPENLLYDTNAKTYVRGVNFRRVWK